MATLGLVSVREDEQVVMKVIAGCDGYHASNVATRLRQEWPVTAERAYQIAVEEVFGSIHDLVVLTIGEVIYDGDDELSPSYKKTFEDPKFNPRWECGIGEFTEVIDV